MENDAPVVGPDVPTAKFQDGQTGYVSVFTSTSPRCLDCCDVDLLHRHHRLEGTLCLTTPSRKCIG
jgi:hypothetical protein